MFLSIALLVTLSTIGCRSVGVTTDRHSASELIESSAIPSPGNPIPDSITGSSDSVCPVVFHQTEQTNAVENLTDEPLPEESEPESFKSLIESETPLLNEYPNEVATQRQAATNQTGLSLIDLEAMAQQSHPAITEARARVTSARGQIIQAGLSPNPVLQYQSDEVGNDKSAGLHSVTISQQFITAEKLPLAQQVQAHELKRRRAQLRRTELEVLTQVRVLFNACLIAQQRSELTQQIVELTVQSIESVQALLEAEEVSRISLLQARVENEQAQIADSNAKIEYQASLRRLSAAIGNGVVVDQRLIGPLDTRLDPQPWSATLSKVLAESPELAAANSSLQRARWALQLACANATPNVTGSLGVGLDTFTEDTFAAVGVSIPLPLRNRNQGNILSARANIASATAALDRTRLDLESRLAETAGRYQTARNRYTRLKERVIPNAQETFELSQGAFDAGETGFLQLLTAQRTLFSTRLDLLTALSQAKQAAAEIEGLLVSL